MANVPNLRFSDYNDSLKNICLSELLSFQNGINADSDKYGKGIKYISVGDIINNDFITYDCIKGKVDISQKELNNYLVENGDILFQRSSETFEDIGNANVYLDEQPCTFGGFVIRGKKIGEYDPKYLNYLLKSPNARKQVIRLGAGAQHYNINQESLNKIILSFPSAKEQEKISQFLTKIEEQIQLQNKIIEGMDSLKQSISIKLFDQLESTVKLCDVCSITKGKQINGSELLEKGQYYMMNGGTEPSGYLNDFNTIEGTISISEGGNSCGYVQYNKEKFWSGGHCYTLKNLSNLIDTKYLYFFLKAKEKDVMALRIGTGLPNIQKKDIESFLIPVPNMEFQNDIVKVLESISLKIDVLKRQLEYYKQQKQYLLSNLFI